MEICAIVLAAGKGSRMKSKHHKGTHKVCGKEMINILIDKLRASNVSDINLVVGEHKEEIINVTKDRGVSYSTQEEQLGTGHAVLCSQEFLKDKKGSVLIFACDTPLFKKESIISLIKTHESEKNAITFVTSFFEDPLSYGRIIRKNGEVSLIREAKDCTPEELLIKEVNTSIYCIDIDFLLNGLKKINNSNAQNEFYLTDLIEIGNKENVKIGTIQVENKEVIGVDSRKQLYYANKLLREEILDFHMNNGVTILDCESTYIDVDVKIGMDTIIYPNVHICGKSIIGEECEILPNTKIVDTQIGNNTKIESSVIYESKVGENTSVGPFAYLRPNSIIGDRVKVGDFVEIKNATIGNETKISHLSYVGDASVGENCNLGCGIVTVNYDGKKKHKTIIGDKSFVGCNVNLVAPVVVGENSYIAAGTTVTEKVDSNSLAIGRCRQTNIKNWVKK